MRIKLEVSKLDIEKLKPYIKRKVTEIVSTVAARTYNTIITGDYPYYSGSYISSWNVSVGSPNTEYNEPSGLVAAWTRPDPIYGVDNITFGSSVYITNAAPHASLVEYEGTPTQPDQGWFVATHARNQILLTYRLR